MLRFPQILERAVTNNNIETPREADILEINSDLQNCKGGNANEVPVHEKEGADTGSG